MEDKPEEEYDHFERAIRKTGCWKEHEACANCINIMKDWRECKEEVTILRNHFISDNTDFK